MTLVKEIRDCNKTHDKVLTLGGLTHLRAEMAEITSPPTELFQSRQLHRLELWGAINLRSIPRDLNNLRHLRSLVIGNAPMLGGIPPAVMGLTQLKVCVVTLPGCIDGLSFKSLFMDRCGITEIPPQIARLVNLEVSVFFVCCSE